MKYVRFITSFPKSYRLAKECRGNRCLSPFQFHIWRWYKLDVEHLIKIQSPTMSNTTPDTQSTMYEYEESANVPDSVYVEAAIYEGDQLVVKRTGWLPRNLAKQLLDLT